MIDFERIGEADFLLGTYAKSLKALEECFADARAKEPLLERAFMYADDGETEAALKYFDRVLDADPHNIFAYIGMALIDLGMKDLCELATYTNPDHIEDNKNYDKALKYAGEEMINPARAPLEISQRLAELYEYAENELNNADSVEALESVVEDFDLIRGYRDATKRADGIHMALKLIPYLRNEFELIELRANEEKRQKAINARDAADALDGRIAEYEKKLLKKREELDAAAKQLDALAAERKSLGIFKIARKRELDALTEQQISKKAAISNEVKKLEGEIAGMRSKADALRAIANEAPEADTDAAAGGKSIGAAGDRADAASVANIPTFDDENEPVELLKNPETLRAVCCDGKSYLAILHYGRIFDEMKRDRELCAIIGASGWSVVGAKRYPDRFRAPDLAAFADKETLRTALYKGIKEGSVITFGRWKYNGSKVATPVMWKVVAHNAPGKYFLIAVNPIKNDYLHHGYGFSSWASTTLHTWMNGEMIAEMFTTNEATLISKTAVSDGNSTSEDLVFIPNADELRNVTPGIENTASHYAWLRRYKIPGGGKYGDYVFVYHEGKEKSVLYSNGAKLPIFPAMWIDLGDEPWIFKSNNDCLDDL